MNPDVHAFAGRYSKASRKLSQDEARSLIETQLAQHGGGILQTLSRYRLRETMRNWHGTIRAIEEFINLPLFGIKDQNLRAWLCSIPLDDRYWSDAPAVTLAVRKELSSHFEPGVIQRYLLTMMQTAAIAKGFETSGQTAFGPGITLETVGAAVNYYQSRRRHLVSLLYTMPFACNGTELLVPLDTLNVLLPLVEHSCVTITSLHLKLAMLETLDDFELVLDDFGVTASRWFDTLDNSYLEPERVSIMEMARVRRDQFVLPQMKPLDPKKIFSAEELRNSTHLVGATYSAFGLNDPEFAAATQLVRNLSRFCENDYYVEIGKHKFQAILRMQSTIDPDELECLLVNKPSEYVTSTNAYEPFIDLGDTVVSNVNLLSRFLYAFKNVHLRSRRRFQIHAGFIFEDMVKRDLADMGFHVTDIKRINRKEFDVIAIHGEAIYNFQCKNNWIDLGKIEAEKALYLRYNRALTAYYRRALEKERARESLLKDKLGLRHVEHYVISRFPVICTDPRIINYNQIVMLETIVNGFKP
jgi:hypothetical protein